MVAANERSIDEEFWIFLGVGFQAVCQLDFTRPGCNETARRANNLTPISFGFKNWKFMETLLVVVGIFLSPPL